jgi:hypothetical protein
MEKYNFDKWLYIIRNLHQLDHIPAKIKENVFERLFEQAEIAKYNEKERYAYQEGKKQYLDMKNALDTSLKIHSSQFYISAHSLNGLSVFSQIYP